MTIHINKKLRTSDRNVATLASDWGCFTVSLDRLRTQRHLGQPETELASVIYWGEQVQRSQQATGVNIVKDIRAMVKAQTGTDIGEGKTALGLQL